MVLFGVVLESDVVVWVLKGRFGLVCECLDLSAACGACVLFVRVVLCPVVWCSSVGAA